jgi:hypothetical protein
MYFHAIAIHVGGSGDALLIGGAIVTVGATLPRLFRWAAAARLLILPGAVLAMALGGSFDEPGHLAEKTTMIITLAASGVIWELVAYVALNPAKGRSTA